MAEGASDLRRSRDASYVGRWQTVERWIPYSVVSDDERQRYAADSRLLSEIGAALVSQNTRLSVRLPADLAARALAAWRRDETGDVGLETAHEQMMRSHAGDVALVGLAVEQASASPAGPVDVELDALQVAAALLAHYG